MGKHDGDKNDDKTNDEEEEKKKEEIMKNEQNRRDEGNCFVSNQRGAMGNIDVANKQYISGWAIDCFCLMNHAKIILKVKEYDLEIQSLAYTQRDDLPNVN